MKQDVCAFFGGGHLHASAKAGLFVAKRYDIVREPGRGCIVLDGLGEAPLLLSLAPEGCNNGTLSMRPAIGGLLAVVLGAEAFPCGVRG